jgi:hypothetical protein
LRKKEFLMIVNYPIKYAGPNDEASLREATKLLEAKSSTPGSARAGLGNDNLTATWTYAETQDGPGYILKVSGGESEASAEFPLEFFRSKAKRDFPSYRITRLWGDLLQERSHRLLQEIWSSKTETPFLPGGDGIRA